VNGDLSPRVNCENATSTPDFANSYLESQCNGSGSEEGLGVELDWMRAFWDVHTDSVAPAVDPTFSEMVAWLVDAGSWTHDDVYEPINTAANARGHEIETNWNSIRSALDGL
jgi:hypothetical protein